MEYCHLSSDIPPSFSPVGAAHRRRHYLPPGPQETCLSFDLVQLLCVIAFCSFIQHLESFHIQFAAAFFFIGLYLQSIASLKRPAYCMDTAEKHGRLFQLLRMVSPEEAVRFHHCFTADHRTKYFCICDLRHAAADL